MAELADLFASALDFDPLSGSRFIRQRNQPYVAPGTSELDFITRLPPSDEQRFQQWVQANKIPFSEGSQDYDMRGFWQGLNRGDPHATSGVNPNDQRLHFSDYWKTPYHQSFSGESKFAGPNAPRWVGDQLVAPDGTVVFDERRK